MIVNRKYKFVYLSMTKTASESLRPFFLHIRGSKNPDVRNRKGVRNFRHHDRVPPSYAASYDKIVAIRNPYTRIASIYAMAQRNNLNIPYESFEELVDYLLEDVQKDQNEDYDWIRWLPTWKYLEPIKNVKHILKFENLQEDIAKLDFLKGKRVYLSHINRSSKYESFDELATPEIIEKVNLWAGKDFELYGYEKR